MYKILIIALAFAASQFSYSSDLLELARTDVKAERKAILAENMYLEADQSDKFWLIFRDYEAEMTKIGDKTVANIKTFAENYETLTDEKAEEILDNSFDIQNEKLKTIEKYTKKISKELGPKVAARFYQIEKILSLIVDIQIMSVIPLAE